MSKPHFRFSAPKHTTTRYAILSVCVCVCVCVCERISDLLTSSFLLLVRYNVVFHLINIEIVFSYLTF